VKLICGRRDTGVSIAAPRPGNMSGRLRPEGSKVEDIFRRLSEIKYQVGRRQSQYAQRGNASLDLNLSDLESKVDSEWRLLCLRAGFEDRAQRPPLPTSAKNLLLSTTQVYQSMVIAYSKDRVIGPRNASLVVSPRDRLALLRGQTRPSSIISSTASSSRGQPTETPARVTESGKQRVILGAPALPEHVAEL
jgi:hypothetical protein